MGYTDIWWKWDSTGIVGAERYRAGSKAEIRQSCGHMLSQGVLLLISTEFYKFSINDMVSARMCCFDMAFELRQLCGLAGQHR